jgi:hypothetical protein
MPTAGPDSGHRAPPWAPDAAVCGSHEPARQTQNQTDREISGDQNRDPEPEEEGEIHHKPNSIGLAKISAALSTESVCRDVVTSRTACSSRMKSGHHPVLGKKLTVPHSDWLWS